MHPTTADGTHFIRYEAPEPWLRLAAAAVAPGRSICVLGRADVGKSTLARYLACAALERGLTVAFPDTDEGQSVVGPPTTIGLKPPSGRQLGDARSPGRTLLRPIDVAIPGPDRDGGRRAAPRRCRSQAWRRRPRRRHYGHGGRTRRVRVEVDQNEALRSDTVVAISASAGAEMRPILRRFEARDDVEIVRLERRPAARRVSRARRRRERDTTFARALERGTECTVRLDTVVLCGAPDITPTREGRLDGTIVGFLDGHGLAKGIGVARSLDLDAGELTLLARPGLVQHARAIQLSECRHPAFEADEADRAEDAASCPGSEEDLR